MKPKPRFPMKSFLFTCLFIGMTIGGIVVRWGWVALGAWAAAVVASVFFISGLNRKTFVPVLLMVGLTLFITVHEVRGAIIQSPPPKKELVTEICVGIVVLIVGIVIIVSLKKLCDRINPPAKKETPPENPPATNCPPHYQGPITLTATTPPTFEFDDAAAQVWDISDYSATNSALRDPFNLPYAFEFEYKFRVSANLKSWTTNSVHGYVSAAFNHITVGTNSMLVPRQYRPAIQVESGGASGFFQPLP